MDASPTGRLRSFALGDVALESGGKLKDATLVYEVHGDLRDDKANLVVFPTFFMGTHETNRWLIGRNRALDPSQFCVVVPNLLGNGISTSPSNATETQAGERFPHISYGDQVHAQQRLVTEAFGVERVSAVVGWSMGACQALHWAVAFPDLVERVFAVCGSAKTSEHNIVFLDSVEAAIRADQALGAGGFPEAGLRAAGRVYAGWGFSGAFYREHGYRALGYASRESFVQGFWETMLLTQDPWNLIAMLSTWRHGDVGRTADTTTESALARVTALTTILSADLDMYFTPEDGAWAAERIQRAHFDVIPGIWGHSAGVGLNPEDTAFIDRALLRLLSRRA